MTATDPALPTFSPLAGPFYEASANGRLVAPRCNACGKFFFSPEIACPHCFASDWEWVDSAGRGSVYSFTSVHRFPGADPKDLPYTLAAIDLDEGWTMLSRLVDCEPETNAIGMRVEVVFRPLPSGVVAPMFRPEL
jgi:uncharacterized OB-fold protein